MRLPRPSFLGSLLVFTAAAGFIAGCSSDPAITPPAHDAGPLTDSGGATDGRATDAPPADHVVPRAPSPIYGPCTADTECQSGLTCLTAAASGLPGGQCNHPCTSDNDCVLAVPGPGSIPVDGFCQLPDPTTNVRLCARICANGIDCERDGYTCLAINPGALNEADICIGVCSDTTCPTGSTCDHQSGRCQATGSPPDMGQHIGESCVATGQPGATDANHCISGHCSPAAIYDAMMRPTYTGFNGGSCYSFCVLPQGYNDSTFFQGTALPQADCPGGSVCFPNTDFAPGDLGVCIKSCAANSDCRTAEGYTCQKRFAVTATRSVGFSNGICTRIDCANTMTPCPTGYTCRVSTTSTGGMTGRCIPGM